MSVRSFDYLVIGGGSGGVASARRAAAHGAKVALVEQAQLGGTCVNVGCVPKKVMYHAAEIGAAIKQSRHYGFDVPSSGFSWETLKRNRDRYVHRLNGIYRKLLETNRVTILQGVKCERISDACALDALL
jgi:glutathione reductase (NADPH)